MKFPFTSLPKGARTKNVRFLAFFLTVAVLLSITVSSFATVSASTTTIFTGPIRYTKSLTPQTDDFPSSYTDEWAVQLVLGTDVTSISRQVGMENLGQIGNLPGYYLFRANSNVGRNENLTASLRSVPGVIWAEQQVARQMSKRVPTDPLVPAQWHLNNTGQNGGTGGEDANVLPAWNAGVSGNGVTIAVVDDGLQAAHPDIAPNFFAAGSYDFNSNEPNPTGTDADGHGTAAGGLAGAADDGGKCGVGVAYNAQLAGLRLIGGPSTDAMEANALGYEFQQNEIYTNSWGPSDNGKVLGAPSSLLLSTFANGVTTGRGGRGSIYVWAGGNGYNNGDHSNADGYASSRFVIAVAASDEDGIHSWYSEAGANIMVTSPSQGERTGLVTTDLAGAAGYNDGSAGEPTDIDCTGNFNGTSAATPVVAGVTALMLEANPNLTWRDVMHILIESADKNDPSNANPDGWEWETNGAGYNINYVYGFGRVDAGEAVALADTWTNVPANVTPYDSGIIPVNQAIPDGSGQPGQGPAVVSSVSVPNNFIVEHVEVYIDADHTYRGDLVAQITSPAGTNSTLLFPRNEGNGNYENWLTTSVRHWGESSAGTWQFAIADTYQNDTGTLNSWRIVLHGYNAGGPQPTPQPTTQVTPAPTLPGGQTELVQNGGFEKINPATGKPDISPWVVKNSTGDKVVCNKPGKPPFANSGNCAFRFKGNPGEASVLNQNLNLSGLSPQVGDVIDVLMFMNVPVSSIGKIKMVVKYGDGTPASKLTGAPLLTEGYIAYGGDITGGLASSNVAKMKFAINNRSTAGKIYFDDISVLHISSGTALVALPGSTGKSEMTIGHSR
jgi:subtilisin-like proprotein convertase family protein